MENASDFCGSILIADDHEVFRFGLVHLLTNSMKVSKIYEAGRFEEALELLRHKDLVLAILDLNMPGLGQPSDLAKVRAARPDIRVVVLSGSEGRQDILGALDAGVHGYIIKSQGLAALVDRLRYVMSGEIYVPPVLAERAPACEVPVAAIAARVESLPPTVSLTTRQKHVLEGLVEGLSNKEIALKLGVSEGTVKMHIASLLRIIGAANRTHAAALGRQLLS